MAIKLKGSKGLRFICGIIIVLSVIFESMIIPNFYGDYKEDKFTDSMTFQNIINNFTSNLMFSYTNFGASDKSEKFNTISQEEISQKKIPYEDQYNNAKAELDNIKNVFKESDFISYSSDYFGEISSYEEGLNKLNDKYKRSDESIKKEILEERRNTYSSYESAIKQKPNIQYVIYSGETNKIEKSNLEDLTSEYIENQKKNSQLYILFDGTKPGNILENTEGIYPQKFLNNTNDDLDEIKNNKIKLLLMIPKKLYYNDDLKYSMDAFNVQKSQQNKLLFGIITFFILALISTVYLYVTRNTQNRNMVTRLYRKLWIELKILFIFPIPFIFISILEAIKWISEDVIIWSIFGAFYSYIILKGTYKTLLKEIDEKGLKNVIKETSLLYKFYLLIKETFIIRSVGGRIAVFSVATIVFIFDIMVTSVIINTNYIYNVIAFSVILLGGVYVFLYMGTVAYIGFKFTGSFNKIVLGAHKISQGDLNYQIEGSSIAVLDVLAKDINNMRSGLGNAIQNEVKSERMKTELITNVSHDLKTPLTSIINYVDLIKKGDFSKEEIEDYIKIIDRKSQRLKVLIDDLFEASSAASGEMELNIEKLDIVALLKQSIAEFEEKIKISKLDFRINMPNEKVYVMVDGKRTWRIFENQISNILKYSLDNTRVYINLEEREDRIIIIFKNISAYEIDFNEDEITERFKRGDQSRHTEGSGLGLAISKGLTELQDGIFKIKVDGDLFKVEIQLKKA